MTYKDLLEFCKDAMFVDSRFLETSMCGNHTEEWKVIKNGRTFLFNYSWGPSYNKDDHPVLYKIPIPDHWNYRYYTEIIDHEKQLYFNF